MSKEKRFKVFATDGDTTWEVFSIVQEEKGDFYFGNTGRLPVVHSRHVSGQTHAKVNGSPVWPAHNRQSLKTFKGMEQLACLTLSIESLSNEELAKAYKGKKFDGSAFIDIRNYRKQVSISPFLLEPQETRLLAGLARGVLQGCQVTVFTQTKPWIVLAIFEP